MKIAPLMVKTLHRGDMKGYRLEGVTYVPGQNLSKVKVPDPKFLSQYYHLELAAHFAPSELNMVTMLIKSAFTKAHLTRDFR